jgi:hypothetical protein
LGNKRKIGEEREGGRKNGWNKGNGRGLGK